MAARVRIVLADDHALVAEGLRGLLTQMPDFEVLAIVTNGGELLTYLETHQVDLVVLDLRMPYSGVTALEEIRRRELPVKVLVLTAFSDGESIQRVLELGAEGFALKTESPLQTVDAIRQVVQGRLVFPQAAQRWLMSLRSSAKSDTLSVREAEILQHVAQGKTNPEIALELSLSENTVRFHLKNIYEKLKVTNRTEAAAWYIKTRDPFYRSE